MNTSQIESFIERLEKEAKALRQEALRFCWFMRGGLDSTGAMYLSADDREFISKLIKENMETTKKSGLPFF